MKLLVVEDEKRMSDLLLRGLSEEGHDVTCAMDGIAGLHEAHNAVFDLVILDIMMPGLNGFEVVRTLRAGHNTTPVLMLTAKDAEQDIVRGLDLGADDYLTKPFSFDELVARVEAIRRRVRNAESSKLVCADLMLDLTTHEVMRDGAKIWLTRREYRLLEALMYSAGEVVSREHLIESIWAEAFVEENTLEAFVRLLRQKVDLPGHVKLIHTVRGIGYMIGGGWLA